MEKNVMENGKTLLTEKSDVCDIRHRCVFWKEVAVSCVDTAR